MEQQPAQEILITSTTTLLSEKIAKVMGLAANQIKKGRNAPYCMARDIMIHLLSNAGYQAKHISVEFAITTRAVNMAKQRMYDALHPKTNTRHKRQILAIINKI
jgi:hypothetical protein